MYCVVGCAWFVFVVYSWFGRLVGFVVQFWVSLLGGCGHGFGLGLVWLLVSFVELLCGSLGYCWLFLRLVGYGY